MPRWRGAVRQSSDPARARKRRAVQELESLRRRIGLIRTLVIEGHDYLDVVGETNEVQARLGQVALCVISDRMRAALSSMAVPARKREALVREVIDALSGFGRKSR